MKYVLGAIGTVLLLLIITLLLFNRGDDTKTPSENVPRAAQLVDYANKNSSVSSTVVGKLVGDEQRRAIRIIVSPNERRLEILSTYDQTILSSESFPNDRTAYENFLSALGGQGFLNKKETKIIDQRSVCPTGNRFVYDLSENGEHISNLWSVSCNKDGTFNGRGSVIRELFQRQIPDYQKFVHGVSL